MIALSGRLQILSIYCKIYFLHEVKTKEKCICRARMGSLTFLKQISLKFKTYHTRILGSFLHMIFNSIHFFDNYSSLIGDTSFKGELVH